MTVSRSAASLLPMPPISPSTTAAPRLWNFAGTSMPRALRAAVMPRHSSPKGLKLSRVLAHPLTPLFSTERPACTSHPKPAAMPCPIRARKPSKSSHSSLAPPTTPSQLLYSMVPAVISRPTGPSRRSSIGAKRASTGSRRPRPPPTALNTPAMPGSFTPTIPKAKRSSAILAKISPSGIIKAPTAVVSTAKPMAPRTSHWVAMGFSRSQSPTARMAPVMRCTQARISPALVSKSWMRTSSQVLDSSSMSPVRLSAMILAVLPAAPALSLTLSKYSMMPPLPDFSISSAMAAAGSSPKIVFSASRRWALPIFSVCLAKLVSTSVTPSTLPLASRVCTPSFFSILAAPPVGADRRSSMARKAVPPFSPWMPTLPSRPAMVAVVCKSTPAARATGPT